MPGTPLSAADIISRFNSTVTYTLTYFNSAPRYSGNFPNGGVDSRLGSPSESAKTVGDLTAASGGQLASTIVFNVLHGFAMEMTRVRRVQAWHRTDALPLDGGVQTTALNSNYAAYFPIPNQPLIGEQVNDATLTSFLNDLRLLANTVRTSDSYKIDIVTCHNSCHSSCHSSRNRR